VHSLLGLGFLTGATKAEAVEARAARERALNFMLDGKRIGVEEGDKRAVRWRV